MEIYRLGKIISTGKGYIIFECNNRGDIINVNNSSNYKPEEERKLFIYQYSNEYNKTLYGFIAFKERMLFEDLVSLNGIGPKTAMSIISNGYKNIINMIINEDDESIAAIPYVGLRASKNIIFTFAEKYRKIENKESNKLIMPLKVSHSLKNLGFQKHQIEYAINNMKPMESIEMLVEEAIRIISNAKPIPTK